MEKCINVSRETFADIASGILELHNGKSNLQGLNKTTHVIFYKCFT